MRIVTILILTSLLLLPSAAWSRCVQGDCLNGQGTVVMPDGRKYVGEFKGGVRVGQGLMTFPDGTKFIGTWQQDKPHGRGKLSSAGNYEYVGEFKNGVRHGQGTLETADGKKYEGQWENDVPHGEGKITYSDGTSYAGKFKNGERHGKGEALFSDGSRYDGHWQDDMRHGQGTITYADDEQYIGEFVNDQKHGVGTQVMADGSKYSGRWQNDVLVKKKEISVPQVKESVKQTEPKVVENTEQEPPIIEQQELIEEADEPAPETRQPETEKAVLVMDTTATAVPISAMPGNFASVLKNGVYVRSGPSSQYRIVRSLNRGYPVEIVEQQDDWARVRDYQESEGWIHRSLLESNNSVIVTTTKANLRSGPGTDNPIVGKIDYGTVLWVKEMSNGWFRVETRDSLAGWLDQLLIWPAVQGIFKSGEIDPPIQQNQPEIDSQDTLQVDESILAQLKEQELARQYEAELSSSQKVEESEKVVELEAQPADTTENILVVESKPMAVPEETKRLEEDAVAVIIEASTTPPGNNFASITSQGKGANIRSAPSLESEVLRAVPTGYPLMVLEQQDNWAMVEDFRGRTGWVYKRLLNENTTVVVKVGKGNLRAGPSLRDDIVAKIDYGTVMQLEEVQEDWVKVSSQYGTAVGWLHKEVIWP